MLQEGQANQLAGDTGGCSKHSFPIPPNLSDPAYGDLECMLVTAVQREKSEGETGDKPTF